jgi:hypothetical protein
MHFAACGINLDTRLSEANAGSMRLWAVPFVLLLTTAVAQQLPREYLIRLPGSDFPAGLRAQGVTPLHHEGKLWAVRASNEKALRLTTEEITPATRVTVELQPQANINQAIADAGGIVTSALSSVPAVSAILPTNKIAEIQKLPGVKRVHKNRSYRASDVDQE